MSQHSKKIVALILAAGESSRLGKPKQILPMGNSTLLNHIKEHLNPNIVERTYIVLGAYAEEVIRKCKLQADEYFICTHWKEGMGSSLAYACSKIISAKEYDGILVTLSDLPLVNTEDYTKMLELFQSENDIVATQTDKSIGVPAIFGRSYFEKLVELKGKSGAKSLIQQNNKNLKVYLNEKALLDVDTLDNYNDLIHKNK